MSAILSIRDLSVRLPKGADRPFALERVSLDLAAGKILCVVGESGSGKSMTAGAIMGLLPDQVSAESGSIEFAGKDLVRVSETEMRAIRGAKIGMIFQEPMTALNPLLTIGEQIAEIFGVHTKLGRKEIESKVLALLEDVHIPDPDRAFRAYPHQLSGGQRQRAMIAMALALEPDVLIADEPTTALDVTTQAQILKLIREMQSRKGTSVLFITHDFGVVAEIADEVAVMRHGVVVEHGEAGTVLNNPQHPYTQALVAAVPPLRAPERPVSAETSEPVLSVANVSKTYRGRGFFKNRRITHAVKDVSLTLQKGKTLGIVGESGSGKSTLARCIVKLLEPDSGNIRLGDIDLMKLSRKEMRKHTPQVQMVFQDPFGSLNPRRKAGELVAQGPLTHGTSRAEAMEKARELFELVGLPPQSVDRFPHEFSGGQRQRIGLARALALQPKLLVADEPVSALDVSVQAQVLALLARLKEQLDLSLLFITHDLRVAALICDDIAVMKNGVVVEHGPVRDVFENPQHEYTKALLQAVPGRDWVPPVMRSAQDVA